MGLERKLGRKNSEKTIAEGMLSARKMDGII